MIESMNRVARFFDADYAGYDHDLPVLKAYARRTGGPLLELGCGTGRALISLAEAGYRVTGVDLSPEMLRIAQAKAQAARVADRVTLIQGDYAEVPLPGTYPFAFVLMNTFLHLLTGTDQLRALRHWRAHLQPAGLLLIDVFHPDPAVLAATDGRLEWDKTWTDPQTGTTVMKLSTRSVNPAEQTVHVTLIYDEITQDGQVHRTLVPYAIRYLWRFEAELLLDKAGFELEAIYGGWDLAPFEDASDRMLMVARRRG
jgi:SAM-dependent methyltransferase